LNLFSERNSLRKKAFSFEDPIKVADIQQISKLNAARASTRATLRGKVACEEKHIKVKANMGADIYVRSSEVKAAVKGFRRASYLVTND